MAEHPSFVADPVLRDRAESPLTGHYQPGDFGTLADNDPGVTLSERFGLTIVELAAWRGDEEKIRSAVASVMNLKLEGAPGSGAAGENGSAFNTAPGRWLVSGEKAELAAELAGQTGTAGTLTDLSHGRTVIRIDGPRSRWVLSKLFAIDFSERVWPVGHGVSTSHHDIHAAIQRSGADAFDIIVFRSFARSFWHVLCRSSEETGYRVT
ncbi:sarcosine oxidase subunit gamma [Oricola cellulosilytica]|uniref:Sarcosine oxidase subunit gamma n=1 Tax=Oricola cellulosilytica TaxID=1429082 RepID=A0A4R0PC88_9HYPH|nr:sarcosine oxidase subunit gamma family protein [Oricola cellulosilytica]TCD15070.1 sarcosine oxidase subunit gamma [Oricola cellulosilytica]